jgi:hypothetical protein
MASYIEDSDGNATVTLSSGVTKIHAGYEYMDVVNVAKRQRKYVKLYCKIDKQFPPQYIISFITDGDDYYPSIETTVRIYSDSEYKEFMQSYKANKKQKKPVMGAELSDDDRVVA